MILPLILSHSRDLGTSPTLTGIFGKILLTLKAPIMTAADDTFCDIFFNFRTKYGMVFHENLLLADDSYEIPCLICYFLKKQQNLKLSSVANKKVALYG